MFMLYAKNFEGLLLYGVIICTGTYSKCRSTEEAHGVFNYKMKKNSGLWTSMITSNSQSGRNEGGPIHLNMWNLKAKLGKIYEDAKEDMKINLSFIFYFLLLLLFYQVACNCNRDRWHVTVIEINVLIIRYVDVICARCTLNVTSLI